MATMQISGFTLSSDEHRDFMIGLFSNVLRIEIRHRVREMQAAGHDLSDPVWPEIKEQITREAFQTIAQFFPEPMRSKLAAFEATLIASAMGLN